MVRDVIVIGAGGQGKVIADIIIKNNDRMYGFLDDNIDCGTSKFDIIGKVSDLEKYKDKASFIVAIGDNYVRKKLLTTYAVNWYTAIHPSAIIANDVTIGLGTSIMANAVVNSGSKIGNGVIINTAATIDHDNIINDYVHVSPGVHLSGTVKIGEESWICTGTVVINNITICAGCTIGAGSVVIESIYNAGTYVGIPARGIKNENIDINQF